MKTLLKKINEISKSDLFKNAIFLILILGLSYLYNYHETIQYRPTSKHQWRNSVSASMALNYAKEGEFFHPRTHNMQVDDFTSDITISEFPLIYYTVGMLYRVFGFHEWIYKLLQILIGYAGLFFLYRLGLRTFKNTVYALFLPIIIFSSPIFIYYLNNFIPDATTLALVLIGLYYFTRFYKNTDQRSFFISMVIFLLAGLIKAPALLIYFAICGIYLLESVFHLHFRSEGRILFNSGRLVAALISVFIISIAWYAYAKIYTDIHGGIVSLVEIRPMWMLSKENISITWEVIRTRFWNGHYHSPYLLIPVFLLLLHNLFAWKKYNRLLSWMVLLSFAGGFCFSILFFRSLKNHDYYQMNNLVIPLLVIINFIDYLANNHAKVFHSWITKTAFALISLALVFSAQKIINTHYYNGWFEWDARKRYNNMYNDITPVLRSLGISRYDKVYCTPDPSINISLYLMDQKGFTDFYRNKLPFSEKLELFKEHGMKYVIVGDSTVMDIKPAEAGLEKIGEHNGAAIYALSPYIKSITPYNRKP